MLKRYLNLHETMMLSDKGDVHVSERGSCEMHGGDLVVQALEEIGCSVVFGLPGYHTGPIYDAMERSSKIRHILVRDERNGAYAADAYARVTGKIGVCDATVGPGAVKLTSGLFEAKNSSIPILALIGAHETYNFNYISKGRITQGLDQLNLLRPLCKEVISVNNVGRIRESIRIAAITACSGNPGPVVVELPFDVLKGNGFVDTHFRQHSVKAVFPLYPTTAPSEYITEAAKLLSYAERPLIVAGGGVLISNAAKQLTELATKFSIPVITTFTGKGSIPDTHPMCLGFTGISGIPMNEKLMRNADAVMLVGTKANQNTTFNWTFPESTQKVIHLDIDPEEMNRSFVTDVCLVGDARLILGDLRRQLSKLVQRNRSKWTKEIEDTKAGWARLKNAEQSSNHIPIAPQRVMKAIQEFFDKNTCVVADASFASAWVAEFLEQNFPGRNSLYPRGSAGLGWGLPAAIGVGSAGIFKKIIVLAGDGGFTYSIAELATLRQLGYPVVSVVLNNASFAYMKLLNNLDFDKDTSSLDLGYTDFAAIAKGFGLNSSTVNDPSELEKELSALIESGKGGVLNVNTMWNETPIWSQREALSVKLRKTE